VSWLKGFILSLFKIVVIEKTVTEWFTIQHLGARGIKLLSFNKKQSLQKKI